jgi:hypothetical protein
VQVCTGDQNIAAPKSQILFGDLGWFVVISLGITNKMEIIESSINNTGIRRVATCYFLLRCSISILFIISLVHAPIFGEFCLVVISFAPNVFLCTWGFYSLNFWGFLEWHTCLSGSNIGVDKLTNVNWRSTLVCTIGHENSISQNIISSKLTIARS